MRESILKQYVLAIIIQIISITLFFVGIYKMFEYEVVALSPVLYIIAFAAILVVADFGVLLFVYKK